MPAYLDSDEIRERSVCQNAELRHRAATSIKYLQSLEDGLIQLGDQKHEAYMAANALPFGPKMDQILRYRRTARKEFETAKKNLWEYQAVRKKNSAPRA